MSYLFLFGSVLLGVLLVIFLKPNKLFTRLLLAFSGAYLLSIAILHLLPEVYKTSVDTKIIGICILGGIVLQSILESFSKGAEHGHVHLHTTDKTFPVLLFISLSIHAFSEGLPIHHAGENLLWAIVVHKIPVAIVLTSALLYARFSNTTTFVFLFLFALMSPFGVYISDKVPFFSEYITEIMAVIIGVFLHISTIILFESTENHKFNFKKFTAIVLGILLSILTL